MRPRGEIRRALGQAAWEAAVDHAVRGARAPTFRDLARRACVGFGAARQTVKDMARAGELQRVGQARVEGSRRPMTTYLPASPPEPAARQAPDLGSLLRTWGR